MKATVFLVVGTVADFVIFVPIALMARDPVGPIGLGVLVWLSLFTIAAVMNSSQQGRSGHDSGQHLPDYMQRGNFYNTQAMRQDLDQIAKQAQNNIKLP